MMFTVDALGRLCDVYAAAARVLMSPFLWLGHFCPWSLSQARGRPNPLDPRGEG